MTSLWLMRWQVPPVAHSGPLFATGLIVLAFEAIASPGTCGTIHVPGDQPTIQQGIDLASPGDTVLVAPGVYSGPGNRAIDFHGKGILLRSETGPESTVIDCQQMDRGFIFQSGEDSTAVIEGLSISNGRHNGGPGDLGGGVLCSNSSPKIVGCTLSGNISTVAGGGIFADSSPVIRGCRFVQNEASIGGAAFFTSSPPTLFDCIFQGNRANQGSAIWLGEVTGASINLCAFYENDSSQGTVYCSAASIGIEGCTLSDNRTGIHLSNNSTLVVQRTIIVFSSQGAAVSCISGSAAMTCSDIFGNAGGDWVGCLDGQNGNQGNFSVNPLFCDRQNGNYTLAANSPCLPGNHPNGSKCGIVGSEGEGCSVAAVESTTWGRIKARSWSLVERPAQHQQAR